MLRLQVDKVNSFILNTLILKRDKMLVNQNIAVLRLFSVT